MSYIYDSFPDNGKAGSFAALAASMYGWDVHVFHSVRAAMAHDPTIAALNPPIVHVDYDEERRGERRLERVARWYGGRYVGT